MSEVNHTTQQSSTNHSNNSSSDDGSIKISKKTLYTIFGVVVIFFLGFSIGRITGGSGTIVAGDSGNVPSGGHGGSGSGAVPELDLSGEPFLGNEDATVTVVEFTDYQCPFCGRHHSQTYPQIKSQYIDTGKIKYVVKDFPLSIHPQAVAASEAANCAGEQDKYFEMNDLLFANQGVWGVNNPDPIFLGFAAEIGLDEAEFNTCISANKYEAEINGDLQEGISAGVSGTPSFLVNGQRLVGAQPFSAFAAAIDAALASA